MEAPETLLETLCDLRRMTYVSTDPTWVIGHVGGAQAPWPELAIDRDIRDALPELRARSAEIAARLEQERRFIMRWIERPSPNGRTRYYEVMVHRRTDHAGWIIWLVDRSAYGRLKMRIDRYYNELIESTPPTDRSNDQRVPLNPDSTA